MQTKQRTSPFQHLQLGQDQPPGPTVSHDEFSKGRGELCPRGNCLQSAATRGHGSAMPPGFGTYHPGGIIENSPAFQRSDRGDAVVSPEGTAEVFHFATFPLSHLVLACFFAFLFTTFPASLQAAWVYESTNEFFSSADFDGDGRLDLVIVDKLTGDYRVGYQLTAGAFTWAGPRASGIDNVTGFSVARFFSTNREALAFTAPAANRVNLVEASSPSSNGLPVSVFPGAITTLAQDFEPATPVNFTLSQIINPPAPATQPVNAGSGGQFLRLLYDGVNDNVNAVAFDQNAPGPYQSIIAEFDFRLASPDEPAAGFAFMLIPASVYGQSGAGYVMPIAFEKPNIPGVFAVAWNVFDPFGDHLNLVGVHWNGSPRGQVAMPAANIDLTSGSFHRARVSLIFTNSNTQPGALVTVTFIPNINGSPGPAYTPISQLFIAGLTNYDCRVEFAGRSRSGLNMSVDLDNLNVRFIAPQAEPAVGPVSIGPNLVVGLDIGGVGNTALDDLVVSTIWKWADVTSGNYPVAFNLIRNVGGTNFSNLRGPLTLNIDSPTRGHSVVLKTGVAARAGLKTTLTNFTAYNVSAGSVAGSADGSRLPLDCEYVAANFSSSALSQFLFYAPGESNLFLYPVREPVPNVFQLASNNVFGLPNPIRQVVVLPGALDTKLLVIFGNGSSASVYNFDGANTPALVQSFTAQAGETFTGAAVLGTNGFMVFSGRNGAANSTFFQAWNFNGSTYTPGASGNLPTITSLSAPGNVFFFSGEPFVTNAPILLRTVNARDWSTRLTGLPGNASALAEVFSNPSNGLRNPFSVILGPAPVNTTGGLVNQYREPISLFGYGPANGDTVADISFTPEPRASASGLSVTISANTPNCDVFYRSGSSGLWTRYNAPVRLFRTTTLYAYARSLTTGNQSRIKSATYTITTPPDKLDSDGDGVPDYVEIAKGTDPTKTDSDSDGYSDFDELIAGSNPNDSNSLPTTVSQKLATFDLLVRPRPYNVSAINQFASSNTPVQALDLQANLLGADLVSPTSFYATLTNVSIDAGRRLLVIATDGNFNVQPTNGPLGRELLGIIPIPSATNHAINYTFSGGDLAIEATAWLANATTAVLTLTRPFLLRDLTINDTLAAALTEQAIGGLLFARGYTNATNITLFSTRPQDALRDVPNLATLLSLESPSNNLPAYSLVTMSLTISNAVFSSLDTDIASLRSITTNIYRISRASNYFTSTNLTSTNLVYPLPLDVLRQFFDAGTIHSNYYAARLLSPEEFSASDLAAARRAVSNILASIIPRPTTNLTLQIRANTFSSSCTLLDATNAGPTWALLDARGAPYRMIDSFNLVPGSQVKVFGFTDAATNPCVPASLEVISIDLLSLAGVVGDDLNHNGLCDTWESLFQISDPNGDADNDGATNLAEFLAGTDPRDANSHPPVALGPAPPLIRIQILPDGTAALSWSVPAEWVSRVQFQILSTPDLRQAFTDTGLRPIVTNTQFQAILPAGEKARFVIVSMTVR